jgi:hypothetical protein
MGKKTDLKDSCAYCELTHCIDLFRHTKDDDEYAGGELYVYKLLNVYKIKNEELSQYVCANGRLLQSSCFVIGPLNVALPKEFLAIICNEVVRDMKASFYLAMSGHYRQAIIIQRCVFENFLFGLYFYVEHYFFAKNNEDKKDVQTNFESWINGGFRKSDSDLLEIIQKGGIISKDEKREMKKLFSELSQFVHTILKTTTGKTINYENNVKIIGCYSEVEFNKDSLKEWSRYFQRLLFTILHKLLILYPFLKNEDAGKLALKNIKAEFKSIKEEINNPYLDELLKMRGGRVSKKVV